MTDETADLGLEHLKRFQQDQLTRFEDRLEHVQSGMRPMKQHMSAFMATEAVQDSDIAGLELPLDRIERRPELRE